MQKDKEIKNFKFRTEERGFTPLGIWAVVKRRTRSIPQLSYIPSKSLHSASLTGFTMVEVVVMLAIITLLSAIVLTSFSGLNEGAVLRGSVREVALAVRKTQNMSLAVRQIVVGAPPAAIIPPAVGVRLVKGQSSYSLFADLAASRDFKYTDASEKIGTDEFFSRNIRTVSFKNELGIELAATTLHVLFSAPEAAMTITDANGVDVGNFVEIGLGTPTGLQTKSVVVRTSGQISVK